MWYKRSMQEIRSRQRGAGRLDCVLEAATGEVWGQAERREPETADIVSPEVAGIQPHHGSLEFQKLVGRPNLIATGVRSYFKGFQIDFLDKRDLLDLLTFRRLDRPIVACLFERIRGAPAARGASCFRLGRVRNAQRRFDAIVVWRGLRAAGSGRDGVTKFVL